MAGLRSLERWAVFLEIGCRLNGKGTPGIPIEPTIKRLQALVRKGGALHWRQHGVRGVTLDQVTSKKLEDGTSVYILLFSCGDKEGADPGFKDLSTKKSRIERKRGQEGVGMSAHLVIHAKQVEITAGTIWYRAILEDVPTVGRSSILPAVNWFLKSSGAFKYADKHGVVKESAASWIIEAEEIQDVVDEAAAGRFQYFELIKTSVRGDFFDEDGEIVEDLDIKRVRLTEQVEDGALVRAGFKGRISGDIIKNALKSLIAIGRERNYDRFRIAYTRMDDKNRIVTYNTPREDAQDLMTKRIEHIVLKNPMDQCTDHVNNELVGLMIGKLTR